MTYLKRYAWAAVIAAVAAGGASAQTTGGTTTTGGLGGTGGGIGGGAGGNSIQANVAAVPDISSTTGGFSQSFVQSSNIIGPYFSNPSFQGLPSATSGTTPGTPGGFGVALYGGTGTAAGGTGGRATAAGRAGTGATGLGGMATAGRTTTGLGGTSTGLGGTSTGLGGTTTGLGGTRAGGLGAGTTGGLGGTTGGLGGAGGRAGGFGGTTGFGGTGANSTNQQLSTGRQVAYTQTLKFAAPPIAPTQLQSQVTSMVSSSSSLSGVSGFQAVAGDGGSITIRGQVGSEDEARLVEGVIRLTPGVKDVKNELEVVKR